ncbi:MAG TPA: hypothetical protein VL853_05535 [Gemmatimonadales bacterium]|nr:hypothetical protein [Gemmatimonadales bacterium]
MPVTEVVKIPAGAARVRHQCIHLQPVEQNAGSSLLTEPAFALQ